MATQHIREEYEEGDNYGQEEEEYEGIQILGENEGGGASNVDSRRGGKLPASYQSSSNRLHAHNMAVGEVVLG